MLANRDHPNAARDRNELATLDPRETHLALAYERHVNIAPTCFMHDSIRADVEGLNSLRTCH
jgi:hypothetical protein